LYLRFLALAHYGPARAFASAGIGVSALAANWKPSAVPQSSVTAKVHKTLDVHRDFRPQIALHLQMGIYYLPDRIYLHIAQIVTFDIHADPGHLENFPGRRSADTVNVSESDFDTLVLR
jgi:hypothetical protein